jgi:hypothetical protein
METPQKIKKSTANILCVQKNIETENDVININNIAGIHQFFIEKR